MKINWTVDESVKNRFKHLDTINSNGRLTQGQIYEYLALKRILRAYNQIKVSNPHKPVNRARIAS